MVCSEGRQFFHRDSRSALVNPFIKLGWIGAIEFSILLNVTFYPTCLGYEIKMQQGVGMVAAALIAGVPLLLIPQVVEQYMGSKRVEAHGAGIVIDRRRRTPNFSQVLDNLLADLRCKDAAAVLSRKFSSFDPDTAIDRAADRIEATMRWER